MKFSKPITIKDLQQLQTKIPFEIIFSKSEKTKQQFLEMGITEINPIENFTSNSIVFINKKNLISSLYKTQPLIIVTTQELYEILKKEISSPNYLITPNVDVFRALFLQEYANRSFRNIEPKKRIHPTAIIHSSARISKTAKIGPNVIIAENVNIKDNVIVGANVIIEENVEIGKNTLLYPNVYIGWDCIIGENCIIHPGTIIGSEGFGFAQDENFCHYRIPQLGIVKIEDNVVIGANCCIDRASYGETLICKGVITDNFVHIAHNCKIGENSIIVAQVGIAGSSQLGKNVICSGQVGISDHVSIPDNTILLARTVVLSDIHQTDYYMGYPAIPAKKFQRLQIHYQKLDKYAKEIRELKKKIEELEKKIENT